MQTLWHNQWRNHLTTVKGILKVVMRRSPRERLAMNKLVIVCSRLLDIYDSIIFTTIIVIVGVIGNTKDDNKVFCALWNPNKWTSPWIHSFTADEKRKVEVDQHNWYMLCFRGCTLFTTSFSIANRSQLWNLTLALVNNVIMLEWDPKQMFFLQEIVDVGYLVRIMTLKTSPLPNKEMTTIKP